MNSFCEDLICSYFWCCVQKIGLYCLCRQCKFFLPRLVCFSKRYFCKTESQLFFSSNKSFCIFFLFDYFLNKLVKIKILLHKFEIKFRLEEFCNCIIFSHFSYEKFKTQFKKICLMRTTVGHRESSE